MPISKFITYIIVYLISKFCTYDIVGHLRSPTISTVLYDIIELRYRSFEHDIVVFYDIWTYDIVGNHDIGGGNVSDVHGLSQGPGYSTS